MRQMNAQKQLFVKWSKMFHHLAWRSKIKANEILRHATDNAKKVMLETEELKKNKTRCLPSTLEINYRKSIEHYWYNSEWDEISSPKSLRIFKCDEAFREIVEKALGELFIIIQDANIDLTRQFYSAEIEELQNVLSVNLELQLKLFSWLNEKWKKHWTKQKIMKIKSLLMS